MTGRGTKAAQLKTLDKADLAKKCGREPPVVQ